MTARPNRRWLQFSLRTFLIVLTLLAMWLGYVSFRAREQRAAVGLPRFRAPEHEIGMR